MNARRPLVVGYGNPLRSDDGVGWHLAAQLDSDDRLSGATILQRHQLTPELALDFSAASVVVLIDAQVDSAPGHIQTHRIEEAAVGVSSSHQLSPSVVAGLSARLYGRTPDVFVVTCGPESTEPGTALSAPVAAAMPGLADIVVALTAAAMSTVGATDA